MVKDNHYLLGLSCVPGLGAIKIKDLLECFGDVASVWYASTRELKRVEGIGLLAEEIVKHREKVNIDALVKNLEKENIGYITILDDNYPEILKNIYDPPPVLFYKGELSFEEPAVAIVGSRRSTGYGRKVAEKLAYELAQRGITIVSGLARGIDTHGHLGALKARGRTIAVTGSGLDIIYPPENKKLYNQIVEKGLVLSEYPPGVKPHPGNFPRRNRIISALSLGVVVVEAARRSGSLITADLALEQGKEVFAVPGNIDRPGSQGTNNLIKLGARLVTGVNDILEELFLFKETKFTGTSAPDNLVSRESGKGVIYPELNEEEKRLIEIIQEETELHINEIIERSGWPAARVNTVLLKLELKGLISREPGKKYSFLGLQNLLKPL